MGGVVTWRRALAGGAAVVMIGVGTVGLGSSEASAQEDLPPITTQQQAIAAVTAGQKQVAAGQAEITAGRDQVAAGQAQVAAGQDKVTAGRAQVSAGQAEITAGQARINAGLDWLAANPPTTGGPPTPEPEPEPPVGEDGTTAAVRHGWGTPIPLGSDEFDYTGPPSPEKWVTAAECWPGHDGNGRRCASRSTVRDGKLIQTGLANGDTGWLGSRLDQRYGRWEMRVRSTDTGTAAHRYHPVFIVWPSSNRWPQDGEYDFLENSIPGAPCAEAFIHYPHAPGQVQQEFAREKNCGAPLSEWHNIAFEWTPQHVKGFIDGKEWFRFSGGARPGRQNIQDMPSGALKIQLDGFHGTGPYRPAQIEVDWVRSYSLNS
ncbi:MULTISPECIES: glycoside hydrolase family 16 protein [Pseudonocardia]|uniref:Beta-glucanase n=2 Tax=Pseudonocardia TaxID=1847 RepID=A0A1Y2N2P4_PSEAH|nr:MULTISPECIES: glycoside hydrolase family 16 protein [Pseudonocardia]OSY41439.1 Beta-glucanase precursor [Pseudonocardia autotrophica]TDN71396.1 beta-glucanase (GH16 family) [Pseudonocardia autotrophica]BBG02072.1 hypothetical protein Pdca_32810 [Pseudonocardia autotrophica]GEC24086.1 hypothetical protein PSA01_11150 [Pseudonocardia saturnea]